MKRAHYTASSVAGGGRNIFAKQINSALRPRGAVLKKSDAPSQ